MIPICRWKTADEQTKKRILNRAMLDIANIKDYVQEWMERVKNEGDSALIDYIRTFDNPNFDIKDIKVSEADIRAAYNTVPPEVVDVIKKQISISRKVAEYRASQQQTFSLQEFYPGVKTGYRITPLDAVGLAVPAGQVPLPTVMQILTVNAKAARVPRIVACYPPTGDYPEMLIAADIAGTDEIYRVGGIAGIAAMAYGTETIKPVLKIAGPGSPYTQAAKLAAYGTVTIDMVAGPSEAVILADSTANPVYCAADILARCEHSPDASAVLITNEQALAETTKEEIYRQLPTLQRHAIAEKALENYSALIVVESWDEAIELTNSYSPEHLEIMSQDPQRDMENIRNAGSIFIGNYCPVAVGDYASGTSHILPTGHWAKMTSPVTIETFQKISEVQELTREGLAYLADVVEIVSGIENLDGHWNSVKQRLS